MTNTEKFAKRVSQLERRAMKVEGRDWYLSKLLWERAFNLEEAAINGRWGCDAATFDDTRKAYADRMEY